MKIDEALESAGLFFKGASKPVENEAKEQKGGFLCLLLGILGAIIFGNMLASNCIRRDGILKYQILSKRTSIYW